MTAYRTLLVALAAVVAAAFAHLALAGRVSGDLLAFVRVTDQAEVLNDRVAVAQQFTGGRKKYAGGGRNPSGLSAE
jgi:hypothetical protein